MAFESNVHFVLSFYVYCFAGCNGAGGNIYLWVSRHPLSSPHFPFSLYLFQVTFPVASRRCVLISFSAGSEMLNISITTAWFQDLNFLLHMSILYYWCFEFPHGHNCPMEKLFKCRNVSHNKRKKMRQNLISIVAFLVDDF